jgi:hypothetical protein
VSSINTANLDREKVSRVAQKIQLALKMQRFTADESLCLLKCLEKLLEVQCEFNGLRVVRENQKAAQ